MINKMNFTKILYTGFMLLAIFTLLKIPYAYTSEGKEINLNIIFVLPHLILYLIFRAKFNGGLEMMPIMNFIAIEFIFHFIPTIYYYMLRSGFKPSILHVVLILTSVSIMFGVLKLDEMLFKYETRIINKEGA